MQAVTITQITPPELEVIIENSLKKVLSVQAKQTTETDRWFDLDGFRDYHQGHPSRATVYGWVSAGIVPCHKSGKRLLFLKSEIDQWLKSGRVRTIKERPIHPRKRKGARAL